MTVLVDFFGLACLALTGLFAIGTVAWWITDLADRLGLLPRCNCDRLDSLYTQRKTCR